MRSLRHRPIYQRRRGVSQLATVTHPLSGCTRFEAVAAETEVVVAHGTREPALGPAVSAHASQARSGPRRRRAAAQRGRTVHPITAGLVAAVLVCAASIGLAGCAEEQAAEQAGSGTATISRAAQSGDPLSLPYDRATAWAAVADHVVIARLVSVSPGARPQATFRVEESVWHRADAPEVPTHVSWRTTAPTDGSVEPGAPQVDSQVYRGDAAVPDLSAVAANALRLDERYLIPLAWTPGTGGGCWCPVNPEAIFLLSQDGRLLDPGSATWLPTDVTDPLVLRRLLDTAAAALGTDVDVSTDPATRAEQWSSWLAGTDPGSSHLRFR